MATMRKMRPERTRKQGLASAARLPLLSNRFGIPVTQQELTPRRPSSKKASVQEHELEFIQRHIKKRQCIAFMPRPSEDHTDGGEDGHLYKRYGQDLETLDCRFCQCGDMERNHTDQAKANAQTGGQWCPENDTMAVCTDAFGEVEFNESGEKLAKYVRADTNTSSEDIMRLLTEAWGLELPNLVISVTGSSVSFDTKSRLSDALRHGLMKAASTTGAWILTGGTHIGITKVVGEAVRDFYLTSLDKVVAIGVAPWGCIQNRDLLVQGELLTVPSYRARGKANHHMAFLDPNHSHFILADNGTRGHFGAHVSFRNKVLKTISSAKMYSAMDPYNAVNVPVCLLVVSGGKGTLQNVHEAVKQGIPTVIIKGSGKMADILAFAYENTHAPKKGLLGKVSTETTRFTPEVLSEIKRMVGSLCSIADDEMAMCTQWIEDCMAMGDVISILDFDAKMSAVDVDLAILKALLKVNDGRLTNQLKLSLVWNRVDIAESIVMAEVTRRNTSFTRHLDDTMQLAIMLGNGKFVDLLLESGLPLKEFLSGYQLEDLYNNIPSSCLLHRLLSRERDSSRDKFNLVDVGNLIKRLVHVFHQHEYIMDSKYRGAIYTCEQDEFEMNSISRDYTNDDSFVLSRHAQHLFVWAVLMNKQELSKVFWRESREALAMALFAQSILQALMKYTNDKDELQELQNNANEYGELALGVLSACYVSDPKRTYMVMTRFIPQWGNTNCVMLAYLADEKGFFSHMASQSLLDNIWSGSLEDENFIKILTCAFFPALLFCVRFRPLHKRYITDRLTFRVPQRRRHQTVKRRLKNNCPCRPNCSIQVVRDFYSAPVVKFGLYVVFYIWFLMMYSYLMLVKMDNEFHYLEGWLIIWVATIFLEEIRQLCTSDGSTVLDKMKQHLFDMWNILDIITILLFSLGMALRHFLSSCGEESRIVLSLNLITFFLRLLHIFSINSTLGPILVMISSMIKDLMWFGIIVLVFILSYGIASEAILCPNSELSWSLLYHVPRRAYWQLYGDLFLENMERDENDTCAGLTRNGNCTQGLCATEKGRYYVTILLGSYVLLTNVLLMNLVIAMFSNTFTKIQEKSDLHWCYQRYRLVYEYASRPHLPPPLIVVSHLHGLLEFCYRKWKKKESTGFWHKLLPHEDKALIQWENVIADNYVRFVERDEANSMEKKQEAARERLETILTKLDDLQLTISRLCKNTEPAERTTS